MPTCRTWWVKNGEEEREPIAATFSDAEWSTLLRFAELASRLRETGFVQNGENFLSILFDNAEVTVSSRLPKPDDLAAFLHRLRPFIHNKEPFHFGKVLNILKRRVRHDAFHEVLNGYRAAFRIRSALELVGINFTADGRDIVSEEMLQAWLYGEEYHFDAGKSEAFRAMADSVPPEIWRTLLLRVLLCKADVILRTKGIIDHLRRRAEANQAAAQP